MCGNHREELSKIIRQEYQCKFVCLFPYFLVNVFILNLGFLVVCEIVCEFGFSDFAHERDAGDLMVINMHSTTDCMLPAPQYFVCFVVSELSIKSYL